MTKTIRTEYKTNAKGAGQIVAKGGGVQRTTPFDQSKSSEHNHGTAAGVLSLVLDWPWHKRITHDSNDAGTKHTFQF